MKIPFWTFSGEELLKVKGDFTGSSFVSQTVGVDNVCERSALKAAQELSSANSRLIQRKKAQAGVTTALALGEWRICFE